MKTILSHLLVPLLLLTPVPAGADPGENPPTDDPPTNDHPTDDPGILVSAEWVHSRLEAADASLVLLHVGQQETYAAGHIPGARYLHPNDYADPASTHLDGHDPNTLMLTLPEPEALQSALRRLGVSQDSHIVVYWTDERVTAASRAIFTLDWAGLGDRASLLDGGLEAWKAAGFEVTNVAEAVGRGNVTLHPRGGMVVDADWVRSNLPAEGYQLVDARAAAYFDGVREDRGLRGHIDGAGSIPWTSLLDEETMKLHSEEQLRELLAAAGVSPGDTVVGYCHIGLFTTLALFSARLLGHEVIIYDGSFEDWASRELPTVSGP